LNDDDYAEIGEKRNIKETWTNTGSFTKTEIKCRLNTNARFMSMQFQPKTLLTIFFLCFIQGSIINMWKSTYSLHLAEA